MNNASLLIPWSNLTYAAPANQTAAFTPPRAPRQCVLGIPEYLQLMFYLLVTFLGVFGNASICYCFGLFHNKSRKSVSEILILYLAVVDFCASIFTPFVFIYWIATCNTAWHFGVFGCKLLPFLGRVFINISVGVICILALDRYRAICSPFKGQFKKKYIHISVILSVLLAILCEIYYLDALTVHYKPLPHGSMGCLVTPDNNLKYIKVTTAILLSRDLFFVLIFTYTTIQIIFNLKRRNIYMTSTGPGSLVARDNRRETEHVIRVIIVMQIVFIVLVLPRDLLHIIFSLSWVGGDGIPYSKTLIRLNDALKVIQTANCCANVFIYAKMHGRFRNTVTSLIHASFTCRHQGQRKASFHEHFIAKKPTNNQHQPNHRQTIVENNNKQPHYSRSLLKNAKLLTVINGGSSGSFVTGDTVVSVVEHSPVFNCRKSQVLLNGTLNRNAIKL